jgi:hypothetical protein
MVKKIETTERVALDAHLETQHPVRLGEGPMNMAFHVDGRTLVIANQNSGALCVVALLSAEVVRSMWLIGLAAVCQTARLLHLNRRR